MSTDQGSYTSEGNAYNNDLAIDSCFNGSFDDMTNYNMVRIWVNTPEEALLRIHYADNSAGDNEHIELFGLYPGNHSSIHNIKKANFARISLSNTAGITQPNVLLRTKFATRIPHPFLNYTNDNVNVNATVALDEFRVSTFIDHETSDILVYGSDGSSNHVILTDSDGKLVITGGTDTNLSQEVLLIGGLYDSSHARILNTDNSGTLFTKSNIIIDSNLVSDSNRLPVSTDLTEIEVTQDTALNLQTQSHLMVDNALVTNVNAVPVSQTTALNLQTQSHLMVDNSLVTDLNPVPISSKEFKVKIDDLSYIAYLSTGGGDTASVTNANEYGMISITFYAIDADFTATLRNGTVDVLSFPLNDTAYTYCKVPTDLFSRQDFTVHIDYTGTGTLIKCLVETYFYKEISEIILPLNSTGILADSLMMTQDTPSNLQTEAHLMVNDTSVTIFNPVPVQLDASIFTIVQDTASELKAEVNLMLSDVAVSDSNPVPVQLDASIFTIVQDTASELKAEVNLMLSDVSVSDPNPLPIKKPFTKGRIFDNLEITSGTFVTSTVQSIYGEHITLVGTATAGMILTVTAVFDTDEYPIQTITVLADGNIYHTFTAALEYMHITATGELGYIVDLWYGNR